MQLAKATTRAQWKEIHTLYERAFPECERKPFWLIRLKNKQGKADMWYLKENDTFAGLAITMNAKNLVLLDYFAIDENLRGKGVGSEALKALQAYYSGRQFFLEIESVYEDCGNLSQRQRRKQFYEKNGMTEMNLMVHLFGTNMEVLGYGCSLDFEEYRSVYRHAYGKKLANKIKRVYNSTQ